MADEIKLHQNGHLCCWRSCNVLSVAWLRSLQWLLVATILVTQSVSSMTVSAPPSAGRTGNQTPLVPELSQINCSTAIATCLKKSQNCGLVHHTYTLGCGKELQGRSPQGLCLDRCRSSLISLSSIIEGYDVITCSCARDDKECVSMQNIANCWPERLDFNESEFERKRTEIAEQRVNYHRQLSEFNQRRDAATAVRRPFNDEQPYNPRVTCSERHRRCKANRLCLQAYIQYGLACRSTIEKRSEPCSAQCAASARVLYSVSKGDYFACICDRQTADPSGDGWCWRQNHLIASKCFGFERVATALAAAAPASGAGPSAAFSPTLIWTVPIILVTLATALIAPYR